MIEIADILRQALELPMVKFALTGVAGTCVSFPLYLLLNNKTSLGIALISRATNITAQIIDFVPHKMWSFLDGTDFGTTESFFYLLLAGTLLEVEARGLRRITVQYGFHYATAWPLLHIFTFFVRFFFMRIIFANF